MTSSSTTSTMTMADKQAAATILADLRVRANQQTAALDDLPENLRPQTLDEAYSIQDVLRPLLEQRGHGVVAGWKIGCTTAVMQDYLAIPHPCAGTLYQQTVYSEYAELNAVDYFMLGLECEIAVKLAIDIPAQATEHDRNSVIDAVEQVMTSVEIVEHRFRDFASAATASLIADDFFSVGCVLGQSKTLKEIGDLAELTGGFKVNGKAAEQHGQGTAILGHPLNALAWLANHQITRGSFLKAGQIVTLGSVVKTIYPEPGMHIEAAFDQLEPVRLDIR